MSGTPEDIDETATNSMLPTMPLHGCVSGYNSIENLKEFVGILSVFNPCFRKYDKRIRELIMIYYDKNHTGCKVIMKLKRAVITIKLFLHGDVLENVDHTFDSSGFQECVIPFLTPAELEKQKRFDNLQVEQKRLMAEQQKIREQEEKHQDEALKKAHMTVPKTCGGVDNCNFCKNNKAHILLGMGWKSNFEFSGT